VQQQWVGFGQSWITLSLVLLSMNG
jgi:hypothetical protein